MTKVVDRIVIDVSSCLTALHLVTHSHYQVFDPVVDFREKSLCFRAVLAPFVHVFVECFITRISGPAILLALFRDEKLLLPTDYNATETYTAITNIVLVAS